MKKVISLISGMFLLIACQKDDTPVSVNEVSLQEAKVFVNAQADGNNQFKEKFIPQWDTFIQQGVNVEQQPYASVRISFNKYPNLNTIFVILRTEKGLEGKIAFKVPKLFFFRKKTKEKKDIHHSYAARYDEDEWIENDVLKILNDHYFGNKSEKCVVCKGLIYNLKDIEQIRRRIRKIPIAGDTFFPNLCDDCTLFSLKIVPLKEVIVSKEYDKGFFTYVSYDLQRAIQILTDPEVYKGAIGNYDKWTHPGGGGGIVKSPIPEFITYHKNVPTCLRGIIENLGNFNSDGRPLPYIGNTNKLSTYIKNLFEELQDVEINFSVLNLGYGYVNGKSRTFQKGKRYGIGISHELLENASELFIAKTVIHEMLHVYFKIKLDKEGVEKEIDDSFIYDFNQLFKKQFRQAEHSMMTKYVEVLAESLAAYDDDRHEFKYYQSLAWSGLEGTEEYQKLSDEEKEEIFKIAKYEREANPNNLCN